MLPDFLDRTELLLGQEALEKLRLSHVLILGLGGVGGAAAEFIARAGVGRLTLVDGDVVESTNRNRQLPALVSTLGKPKAEVVAARLRDINPEIELDVRCEFIRDGKIAQLLETRYDYAVDAIDSLSAKVHFILKCVELGVPLISSMGSGGRRDLSKIGICDIAKTHNCALARSVRQMLGKHDVRKGVEVVFSPEEVPKTAIRGGTDGSGNFRSTVGTISYVPAVFGAHCAQGVINGLLKEKSCPQG